jgi:hypothetical protein
MTIAVRRGLDRVLSWPVAGAGRARECAQNSNAGWNFRSMQGPPKRDSPWPQCPNCPKFDSINLREALEAFVLDGGRYWDRTSGPCRVKQSVGAYESAYARPNPFCKRAWYHLMSFAITQYRDRSVQNCPNGGNSSQRWNRAMSMARPFPAIAPEFCRATVAC